MVVEGPVGGTVGAVVAVSGASDVVDGADEDGGASVV
ncbi:MAG: hypothetical protein JWP62_1909, partial [Blastococcus sp.]|nr:hypothetical protein [Blastococcus sp.]